MLLDQKQISLLSWFSSTSRKRISKDLALKASALIVGDDESPYFILNSLVSLGLLDYTAKGGLALSPSLILRNKNLFVGINIPVKYSQDHFSILTNEIVEKIEAQTSIPILPHKPMAWKYAPNLSSIIKGWDQYDIAHIDINELEYLSFGGWKDADDLLPGVYRFKNMVGSYRLIRHSSSWYKMPPNIKEPFSLDISFTASNRNLQMTTVRSANSQKNIEIRTYLFPPILLRLLIHSVFFNCHFTNGYRELILNEQPKHFSIPNFKKAILA